jgi:hypothetical protein
VIPPLNAAFTYLVGIQRALVAPEVKKQGIPSLSAGLSEFRFDIGNAGCAERLAKASLSNPA